ncbi:MAG TPA: ABC transporter permease [Ktedonobacterales bacterium]|nr:ABC transporter permease [Ktedonobacterales bacterium]
MKSGEQPHSLFDDPLRFKPKDTSPAPSSSLFDDPLRFTSQAKTPSLFDDPLRSLEERIAAQSDPEEEIKGPSLSPTRAALRRFRQEKFAMGSLVLLLGLFFFSLIFPPIYEHIGQPLHEQITPGYVVTITSEQYHGPEYQDATRLSQLPSALHWLGTDDNGQDILARLLTGSQVSMLAVIAIEIQDIVFGVFFGVLAGYFGGIIDTLLARFTDLMFAFPGVLFAILIAAIFGPLFDDTTILGFQFGPYGRVVLNCLVLGLTIWPQMARFARAQTLQLKEQEFVMAARANGTSTWKIIRRHIVPNMTSLIIVAAVLDLTGNIGAESALSFLGLGVQPPGSGLGLMISQYAQYLQAFPFEIIWPIASIIVLTLACSYIGSGLEAAFDPREQDYGFLVVTEEEKSKLP